jgi:predicted transcriptional regulator
MSTTTVRIDDHLKDRIAAAAARAGQTPHAFIVEAITQTVERAETEEAFNKVADERWVKLTSTGESVPWSDTKEYMLARARGEKPVRPKARKISR